MGQVMKQIKSRQVLHRRFNYYFPQFPYHDQLDHRLWLSNGQIRTLIFNALNLLIDNYIEFLRRMGIPMPPDSIHDIILHGSATNYYYDDSSDIDICIVVDLQAAYNAMPTVNVMALLNAAMTHWRRSHEINVCGMRMDIAFTDVHNAEYGGKYKPGSMYSLKHNKWLVHPTRLTDAAIREMKMVARQRYQEIRKMYKRIMRDKMGPDFIETFLNRLEVERKQSLIDMPACGTNATVLAFRMMRRAGIYEKLRIRAIEQRSKNFNLSF